MTAVVFVVPSAANLSTELPDYEPLDVGPKLRDGDYPIEWLEGENGEGGGDGGDAVVLDTKTWLSLDDYAGYYFFTDFELRAESDLTEIWVQVYEERAFPEGDPRETPVVTQAQVEQLLSEFDGNIYETVTDYFGVPHFHDGSMSLLEAWGYFPPGYYGDADGKNVILVSNFGDENYYDPDYPYYIAGFFSSTLEAYHDRNIISIDTHDWENRVGPDGSRPYLYEGVIAHEEQHLVHSDYRPGDDLFINEGCSMFAEVLCGYGVPWGDINSFLATPDNSLIEWGDQGGINTLADYGAAALWSIYCNDQFGDNFWSDYMAGPIGGIPGMEALFGGMTFDEVFHNWRLANLIHSDWPGSGKYDYKTMDLADADPVRLYEMKAPFPWTMGSDFGTTVTILGYDAEGTGFLNLGPYSTDYIAVTKWHKRKPWWKNLFFDGDDSAYIEPGPQWTLDGDLWWSGSGDLYDNIIAGETTVGGDGMLYVTTYYDLEDNWDFGFVQVSTDGGMTWTSLENAYTTYLIDPAAIQTAVDNLPGLTSWSEYIDADGWITMAFDLTAYAGQDVLIGFHYVTDWATHFGGWYVMNNVTQGGEVLELDVWYPPAPEADFMVSLVYYAKWRGNYYPVWVREMGLDDMTEEGMKKLGFGSCYVVIVVSAVHDLGVADYSFKIDYRHKHHCWSWGE